MAILVDIQDPGWWTDAAFRDALRAHLPDADIRCWPDAGERAGVTMLALVRLRPGLAETLPNLALVQKLGAGVETIVENPGLPAGVRVARLREGAPAEDIAEYCVAYVLREQRNMRLHERGQRERAWRPEPPRRAAETTVGVLGLGHIGAFTARRFAALGFRVLGWSRGPKTIEGVEARCGDGALPALLGECDYVASILPSTPQTRGLMDARAFAAMKPGAVLVNAGRGDLVDEAALVAALDAGTLAGAVLDVTPVEPLPPESPLWSHPGITITPHVSGWHFGDGLADVAENYRRLLSGRPLLNEVDRGAGY